MARYAAQTGASDVTAIDVVSTAGRIVATAASHSAFLEVAHSARGERQRIWTKRGPLTWSTSTAGVAPDEKLYTPTSVSTTNIQRDCDVVIEQEALMDGATSGTPLVEQVVGEGAIGYATFIDALGAGLYATIDTAAPDHVIGSATAAITGPLIDQGIELLLIAAPPGIGRLALIIYSGKIRELMQIPGMRDKSILGGRNDGVDGPNFGIEGTSRMIVRGYGGILDIYHSDQIISSTGRHNIMLAVGDGGPQQAAMVNPWTPIMKPGVTNNKMNLDVVWNEAVRAVEVNMTTYEDWEWRDSATASTWAVDLVTA